MASCSAGPWLSQRSEAIIALSSPFSLAIVRMRISLQKIASWGKIYQTVNKWSGSPSSSWHLKNIKKLRRDDTKRKLANGVSNRRLWHCLPWELNVSVCLQHKLKPVLWYVSGCVGGWHGSCEGCYKLTHTSFKSSLSLSSTNTLPCTSNLGNRQAWLYSSLK